ncbi:HD domain-containing protein [Saccharothrix xinjiangensis]|uniref:Caspase family protein n=1 Tax=Saccharothrix xinjiangensis TaxID=204798 RepID=A0ABV9YCA5_9PSEU
MDAERIALLIGVPHAPDASSRFEPLDEPVRSDLDGMRAALAESGYDVRALSGAGRSEIGTRIFETARDAPEGSTLLIYFTGHGVRIGDEDYLVPADARAPREGEWTRPYRESLLPADISDYLEECRAGTVLWLIDACRDVEHGREAAFGTRIERGAPAGRFAVLVGCGVGESCGYSADGSFFTRGLVEALSALSAPRTVEEVHRAARLATERLARGHRLTQHVQIRYGADLEAETRAAEICDGRHLLEEWRAAVDDERLWALAQPCGGLVPRLREGLLALVGTTARAAQDAHTRLPDPWTDDDFVPRLLTRLEELAPSPPRLSAVEVAVLVAAVLLREAAWAALRGQAAEVDPMRPDRVTGAGPLRKHLEQVYDQHAHITDKLAAGRRGLADRQAVASWLVDQWIAERFETDDQPVPRAPAAAFARAVLGADEGQAGELAGVLCRLAAGMGVEPPQDRPDGKTRKVWLPEGHQVLHESALAALLRAASALAVDVRVLPEVVAEHLAVSDKVEPKDAIALVRDSLHWHPDEHGWHMDVSCPHQALHAALEELADRADRLVVRTHKQVGPAEAALLTGVPRRVTAAEVRPRELDGDQTAYDVPLLRFSLAQTEVRGLLMGRQLYGDPALAVRELYQNAMDACRYRAMRWEFLRRTDRNPQEWRGRIVITQGEDERGRFIECRDNGVGMGLEQLTNTFTRAGSRFERSKSFRREQATWLRKAPDLRLYPNSRFGIGVFSYFMLADEMTLVTRQVSVDGVPAAEALRVDIAGSGSLFRIQPHTGGGDNLTGGGTLVRLYLRDDPDLATVSCVATLRSLVKLSEFELQVGEDDLDPVTWEPGKLQLDRTHGSEAQHEAVPGVLWWVNGAGAILCDGIKTDQVTYGYVLNLTAEHAGTLSVSRNELQSYDEEWARRNWRQGARRLPEWPGFTMQWLWSLAEKSPVATRELWQEVRGKGLQVRESATGDTLRDLDVIGIFPADRLVVQSRTSALPQGSTRYVSPWRVAVLGKRPGTESWVAPESLTGHPFPEPDDTALITEYGLTWIGVVGQARLRSMTVAETVRSLRRLRIAHPMLAPPPVRSGYLSWCPDKFDKEFVELLVGDAMRHGRVITRNLVFASQRLSRPLGWLVERFARYAPLRQVVIPEVPPYHRRHVCTADEVAMLLIMGSGAPMRPVGRVEHAADVRQICVEHGFEVGDVLDCLRRFQWLGWHVPDAEEVRKLMVLEADLVHLLVDRNGEIREQGWGDVLYLAAGRNITLGEAEEVLAGAAEEVKTRCARRWSGSDLAGAVLSPAAGAVVRKARELDTAVEKGFGLWELASALPSDFDVKEVPGLVDELRRTGIEIQGDIRLITEWDGLTMQARYALSGVNPAWASRGMIAAPTSNALFSAAVGLGQSLGGVRELVAAEAVHFGFPVPVVPDELRGIRPTWREERALLSSGKESYEDDEVPVWLPVTAIDLALYARTTGLDVGTAYERLESFRPMGALLPELPPRMVDDLKKITVDARDLLALDDEYRLTRSDEPLLPLDLVSIAARLGEPISRTWDRIRPYLELMPEPRVTHFPDEIPRWQDLAILSHHLDGKLPAITGAVDPAHVTFVADEVGESEEWVVDRLRHYADMFGLDLSAPDLSALSPSAPTHEENRSR